MSDSTPAQIQTGSRQGKRPKQWRSSGAYHLENIEKAERMSHEKIEAAQRATASLAKDPDDAALLLRMLGIYPDNVEINTVLDTDTDEGLTA